MSVKHPAWRRFRLWLIVKVGGGRLDNARRCGCVDYYPAGWRDGGVFKLLPCDSCGEMLARWIAQDRVRASAWRMKARHRKSLDKLGGL